MKTTTVKDDLLHALDEGSKTWYARANGIDVGKKCQVCRIMKSIASDPKDICMDCPVSKLNNDEGCPDDIQKYKESKKDEDRKIIARRIAEFLDASKVAFLSGRYV